MRRNTWNWKWVAVGLMVVGLAAGTLYAAMTAKMMGQYGGWQFYSAELDVPAGATTELVAAVTGKRIRVVGIVANANVAGTATLKSSTTAISGDFSVAATGGFVLPCVPNDSVPFFAWAQTAAGEALNITTVTCTIDGVLVYAVEP